jgi:hypothetical protein
MSKRSAPAGGGREWTRLFKEWCGVAEKMPELFGDPPISDRNARAPRRREKIAWSRINKLSPGTKRRAIERKGRLSRVIRRYVRCYGAPANTAEFIRRLREKGLLEARTAAGEPLTMSDSTARRMLQANRKSMLET